MGESHFICPLLLANLHHDGRLALIERFAPLVLEIVLDPRHILKAYDRAVAIGYRDIRKFRNGSILPLQTDPILSVTRFNAPGRQLHMFVIHRILDIPRREAVGFKAIRIHPDAYLPIAKAGQLNAADPLHRLKSLRHYFVHIPHHVFHIRASVVLDRDVHDRKV